MAIHHKVDERGHIDRAQKTLNLSLIFGMRRHLTADARELKLGRKSTEVARRYAHTAATHPVEHAANAERVDADDNKQPPKTSPNMPVLLTTTLTTRVDNLPTIVV